MDQIYCDLIPGGKMPLLNASQYDEGRTYRINLTENKQPYILDGTELLTISIRKGDNTLFTADVANTFANKSYVDFVSTKQMCACKGFSFGELSISINNTRVGTINFYLIVEQSPEEDGVSCSEINNLARQVSALVDEEMGNYYDKAETDDLLAAKADETDLQDLASVVDTKANISDVNEALTHKADKATTYTKTQVDNLVSPKADKSYVDTNLALKADKSDTYTKNQVDTALSAKADTSTVTSALALKADKATTYTKTQVDNLVSTKADKSYVDTNLALKADKSDTYTKTQVDNSLNNKMDKTNPVGSGSFSFNRLANSEIGSRSFAEGYKGTASGSQAHAEGYESIASGSQAHAEGYQTIASGNNSHAEGFSTQATAYAAHSEGNNAVASGSYSHAEGNGTIANHKVQHVFGEYNVADASTASITNRGYYIEIVGNGTGANSRSNARTLDWQGNEVLGGNLTFNGSTSLTSELDNRYTKAQVDAIVAAAVDSVLPTGKVSGAFATFKTSLEKPLLSLKANIDYKADGITEVNISHLGANVCEEDFEQGFINASGAETPSSSSIRSKNYNVCIPNQEFFAKTFDDPACYLMFYDASKTFIERKQANNQKVVASATARYFRFSCYNYGQGTYDVVNKPVSINLPSSDTAYHAYSKTVKTVDISDYTIYGGTLEITPTGATLTSTKNADGTDKATPDVYQLTGVTDITPNIGANNILADTGDVDISFKCTVEDYVEAN